MGSYASPTLLHGDARQYHLALPWITSLTGSMTWDDTLLHSGTYLGYDILYLAAANLAGLMQFPFEILDQVRLFSTLMDALMPISAYLLCRTFGGSRGASVIASLAMFTLGSIGYWGLLKNDIVCAALAAIALAFLVRANQSESEQLLWLATAIAAYSVTVKISNAAILTVPFLYVYVIRVFSVRARMIGVLAGILILTPWLLNAYFATGNPLSPIGGYVPDEVRQAWAVRNSNGIEHSFANLISKFVPIVLSWYRISGNQSLGWLALGALTTSLLILMFSAMRRKWGLVEVIAATALVWFILFYVMRYDGRFLARYVLVCFIVLFAFVSARLEAIGERLTGWLAVVVRGTVLALVVALAIDNSAVIHRYEQIARLKNLDGMQLAKHDKIMQLFAPYAYLDIIREPGEAVAINDHMILFLEPPFINLHAMHAVNLNLYTKNFAFVKDLLLQHEVKYLLLREGISGSTPAVTEYVERCARKLKNFGPSVLYKVTGVCQ